MCVGAASYKYKYTDRGVESEVWKGGVEVKCGSELAERSSDEIAGTTYLLEVATGDIVAR